MGKSYSARVAASILNACNLNQLITHNESDYEDLAYELATNKEKYKKICEEIRNQKECRFFDSTKFTKDLERIYSNII